MGIAMQTTEQIERARAAIIRAHQKSQAINQCIEILAPLGVQRAMEALETLTRLFDEAAAELAAEQEAYEKE